jgi:uncharacterized protein (TIGR02466 family)
MTDIIPVPLFSVPLHKLKVTNHNKIKKYLMDNIYPQFLKDGANDKITNAYTDYVPGAVKAPWQVLSKFYDTDIEEFLKHTGVDFAKGWTYKVTCWYGMMTNSTSQFVHDHTGGPTTIQWSAVHYVELTDPNAGTIFVNPNARMIKSVVPTKNKNELPEIYWPVEQQALVEEGDLLIFPSWLDHHTPKHTTGNLRVVVAMNIMLHFDNVEGY